MHTGGATKSITLSADKTLIEATLEEVLTPLWRVPPSAALDASALALQERYGFSFYDSLIVAAALAGGCTRLLSEDLQHGQRIDDLRIEDPFRSP